MGKISLDEVKNYLGLDGDEQNALLAIILSSAEHTVEKILRRPIRDFDCEIITNAVLITVWQLYFHRDNKELDYAELENTLAVMLSDLRKKEF